jgi:hypothetical protein
LLACLAADRFSPTLGQAQDRLLKILANFQLGVFRLGRISTKPLTTHSRDRQTVSKGMIFKFDNGLLYLKKVKYGILGELILRQTAVATHIKSLFLK